MKKREEIHAACKKVSYKQTEYQFFPLRWGYTFQPTQAKFSINFGVGNEHIYYWEREREVGRKRERKNFQSTSEILIKPCTYN